MFMPTIYQLVRRNTRYATMPPCIAVDQYEKDLMEECTEEEAYYDSIANERAETEEEYFDHLAKIEAQRNEYYNSIN